MIGKELMEWRIRHGFTRAHCAEECGVSFHAWSQWEHGNTMPRPPYQRLLDEFIKSVEDNDHDTAST